MVNTLISVLRLLNVSADNLPIITESQTYEHGMEFFQNRILEQNKDMNRMIYLHETCATDSEQVRFVLDSCLDMILQLNLKTIGVNL